MRVLIVNTLYPPAQVGGAERSVAQLAQGLRRAGVEASVLTLTLGRATVNERIDGVPVQRLPVQNLYWPYDGTRRSAVRRAVWHGLEAANPLMDQAVDRAVARVRPDLIHLHLTTGFSLSVYRAAARRDLPLVQTLRDWSMLCARASLFRRGRRCERRCGSCILLTAGKRVRSQGVDHVIGLSGPVLETHRAACYFRRTPGSVIGNAAGAAAIAPSIGHWTAQYIAMRALRWPDAWPSGDVALIKALGITGKGRATYPDGSIYEGAFLNALPHGTGTVKVFEGGLEIFNDAGTGSTVLAHAAAIVRLDI